MTNVLLTPPFRFNVAPDALGHDLELAPVLAEYGVKLTANPAEADLELVGTYYFLDKPTWRLPKERVVVITPEPPQPDYMEAAYLDSGFSAVLTPVSGTVLAPDCMAYFAPPGEKPAPLSPRNGKTALLATFRYNTGNAENGAFLTVRPNGGAAYSHRTLAFARSMAGLLIKRVAPEIIDLYGRYWPQGTGIVENSRESGDWRARKLDVLSRYSFNLCWENSEIPGYVTEKIWDAIEAGCLPLYFGPAEFHAMLPKDSILDCRRYVSGDSLDLTALLEDVLGMDESERLRRVATLRDWHAAIDPDAKRKSAIKAAHILGRELAAAHARLLAKAA